VLAAVTSLDAQRAARATEVPFVPTPPKVVDAMLDVAKVGPNDFLIDLGSGDGRIVIAAAKRFGTRGFGVDIDGVLVSDSRREAQRQGVADKVAFHAQDLFITDIGKASVLTMYLYPQVIMRLRPKLFTDLRPGTRVVSHDFDMDKWQPDAKITVPVPDKPYGDPKSDVYLWVIPANAAGTWRGRIGSGAASREHEVVLEQTFQMLKARAAVAGETAQTGSGRVRGEAIEFAVMLRGGDALVRHEFSGRVSGDTIRGNVTINAAPVQKVEWSATRAVRGRIDLQSSAPSPARQTFSAQER
jgi:hypothetical protein